MVDFATHFTIHAVKIGFQNSTFTWKVLSLKIVHLPIACQSYSSLEFPHAASSEKIQGSLVVRKQLLWEELEIMAEA